MESAHTTFNETGKSLFARTLTKSATTLRHAWDTVKENINAHSTVKTAVVLTGIGAGVASLQACVPFPVAVQTYDQPTPVYPYGYDYSEPNVSGFSFGFGPGFREDRRAEPRFFHREFLQGPGGFAPGFHHPAENFSRPGERFSRPMERFSAPRAEGHRHN